MTYYAFIQNNKINGCGQCPCTSETIFSFEITEEVYNNIDHYIWDGSDVVLNANYDEEQAAIRESNFKSQFFEIVNYGFYRKQPKGYTSALESLSVAYNMVTSGVIQELPAGTFIFYQEPDYTIPEQCTEEWLINHQILSETMTAQQFLPFYAQFVIAWNQQMHESELKNKG
jgi:hypothetical protein